MQEKEGELADATVNYNKAADAFKAEDASTSSNQMLLKVAELTAAQEEYEKAIEIYNKVCEAALESRGQSHSVKDYMFKVGFAFRVSLVCSPPTAITPTPTAGRFEPLHPERPKRRP